MADSGMDEPAPFLLPSHTVHAHVLIELVLVLVILFVLWWRPGAKKEKGIDALSEREIDQLCDEWRPDPLVEDPKAFRGCVGKRKEEKKK